MNDSQSREPQPKRETALTGLAAIRVGGPEAENFLQGQLTQDVSRLTESRPMLAGWANAKGRLLCVATLLAWQDAIWLVLPQALLTATSNRLRMFVLRADVSIDTPSVKIGIAEQRSDKIPDNNNISYCYLKGNFIVFRCNGGPVLSLSQGDDDAAIATEEDWRAANIRAGIPTIWPDTLESFVPQMLNLDLLDGISFTKGCYVGQEIVARTQNLGRIKRRMYGFSGGADLTAQPGDPVFLDGRESGQVVDAISSASGSELLAVVRIDQCEQDYSLDEAGKYRLRQRPLPYPVPQSLD